MKKLVVLALLWPGFAAMPVSAGVPPSRLAKTFYEAADTCGLNLDHYQLTTGFDGGMSLSTGWFDTPESKNQRIAELKCMKRWAQASNVTLFTTLFTDPEAP